MIYLKVHNTPEGDIVAMCDRELIGKVYKEAKFELDLEKYSDFYKGSLMDDKDAETVPELSSFYTANIVGKRSVGIFLKKGIVSEGDVKKVKNVPYVHVYRVF